MDEDYIYYHMERYEDITESGATIAETALCRIKTDGTNRSKLTDSDVTGQFFVEDGWIYYVTERPSIVNHEEIYLGALCKVNFDGTQQQKLYETDVPLRYPVVAGDWVYFRQCNVEIDENGSKAFTYSDADGINLYKVKKDGTEAQRVDLRGDTLETTSSEVYKAIVPREKREDICPPSGLLLYSRYPSLFVVLYFKT